MRKKGITMSVPQLTHGNTMNLNELIRYKALHLKYVASNSNVMELLAEDKFEHTVPMKNVCAMVSQQLFDDLTSKCELLDISKRSFIEAALIEALEKAEKILEEERVFEYIGTHALEAIE